MSPRKAKSKRRGALAGAAAEAGRGREGLLPVSCESEGVVTASHAVVVPRASARRGVGRTRTRIELKTTRNELRNTSEQPETANEELKAPNEGAMSANEELQTSNEGASWQSLAEGLRTINAQLQTKVDELERTNNDLDALLSSTDLATVLLDLHFRVRRFAPATIKLFNLIPSDVGRPLSDMAQKFSDPELPRDAEVVLERLTPVRKEVRTHEGRWYMREARPYRTRDQRIEGVVITFSDAAEEVLQEARLRAQAIIDSVRASLLVLDASLRVVSANRAFYETLRTSPQETEGRSFFELCRRKWSMPALRAALEDVSPKGKPLGDFEVHCDVEQIGEPTMLLRARPLARRDGRADQILLVIEDVTERKRFEEALRESEGKVRAIVESTPDGIITIDEHGTVTSFNPAAERIFGYPAAEVIRRNVSMLMPSPYHEEHDRYLRRHLETGVARIIGKGREVVGRRKDGTTFPMDLSVGEYHDGTCRHFVVVVRDITQRRKADDETRRHEAELARVLRVNLVGELAAGLAHELSQPLAAIANTFGACITTLRRAEGKPKTLLPLLKQAAVQSMHAGRIIHDVRELVRRQPRRRERTDIRRLVENAARLTAGEIAERHIELQLALGNMPLPVRVSRVEIEQVLLNLIQNAIDAICQAGRKRRQIVVQASRTGAKTVELIVRDTGTGVADALASRIFEPFFTTKPGGLGMGLAMCRSIVEAHGGRLSVAAGERSNGASMRLTLPADRRRTRPARSGERPGSIRR